jgi:hypothetical protein
MLSRNENIVLAIIVTVAMIIGINQLSSDNDIFAETLVYCCNAGYCHDMPCSATSSVRMGPNCTEYILTCGDCMEIIPGLIYNDCLYIGPDPTWCN